MLTEYAVLAWAFNPAIRDTSPPREITVALGPALAPRPTQNAAGPSPLRPAARGGVAIAELRVVGDRACTALILDAGSLSCDLSRLAG
jgi:hypothetical protein